MSQVTVKSAIDKEESGRGDVWRISTSFVVLLVRVNVVTEVMGHKVVTRTDYLVS